ncbi:hypothetical protein [Kribbella sp. HUAS MG21]|uniref:DUF4129 domain-containing protein n=1 Tax=Kribbella sp. HUAS MG21 TaxID=3160966 RepID=A0AAU7T8X5_9ACTN
MDELMRQVDEVYERAVFNGEYGGLPAADRALDAVEARHASGAAACTRSSATTTPRPSRTTGDKLPLSYDLRHLGVASHISGNLDEARARLS